MRTDKELLQLLLDWYKSDQEALYLCAATDDLYYSSQITTEERIRISEIIDLDCKDDTDKGERSLDGYAGKHPTMPIPDRCQFRIDWLTNKINSL